MVARFPEDPGSEALAAYRQGSGVDALAGAEAVISHLLSQELGLPCAHAPALSPLPLDPDLDPRAAGEELGYTFLACVLVGLNRAPDLLPAGQARAGDLQVDAHALGLAVLNATSYSEAAGLLLALREGISPAALRRPL